MSFKYLTKTDPHLSYSSGLAENFTFLECNLRDCIDLFARLHPSHVAYIFAQNGGYQMTYIDLKHRVELTALNLIRLGFKTGLIKLV